ncbi:MAG: acyl-CoA dehydratase activase [Candidatus Thorarchaeota archaeon]
MSHEQIGIGIDVGSTTTKGVIINSDGEILASSIHPTGASANKAVQTVLDEIENQYGRTVDESIVSTGYGRRLISLADRNVTEITCHSLGVHHLFPQVQLVIDVGGQDSKAIRVGADGRPIDFELNDKCSAGTGRFLEVMASVLDVRIEDLGPLALRSKNPCSISSTCTVFAESEVISQISSGETPEDIAAGVNLSMASKIANMSKRVGIVSPVVATGGVALNPAFVQYLEQSLEEKVLVPQRAQFTGALGAALLSLK